MPTPSKRKGSKKASEMTKPQQWTSKQRVFLLEYLKDFEGKRAALAAGVPEASASTMACEWLDEEKFPHITVELQRILEERRRQSDLHAKQVVAELARICFFNPKRLLRSDGVLMQLHELPDDVAACIREFKVKVTTSEDDNGNPVTEQIFDIKFWDKLEALRQISEHLGLLKDVEKKDEKTGFDWDELARTVPKGRMIDEVEQRIKGVLEAPAPSPPRNGNGVHRE
jgi:phage terminase small subunit